MQISDLRQTDDQIASLISQEEERQRSGLEMIPSENHSSPAVREALGSILTDKYSEGYPGKRYYGGNEFVDQVEILAQERAKKLFGVPHVNVQPYSGSPANLAVYLATVNPGDTIMGLNLLDGGHLTHGWKVSATAVYYKSIPYHVDEKGKVDIDEVWRLVKEHKPKLIWTGATAYVYQYEFDKFAEIAESAGAYYAADIAHVAGLIAAGVHASPIPYAHVVTTTTHKTLRGPRGGMIMVTERGLAKDPDLADKVDRAIFPGLQGGPHDHQTAAIAVALKEAAQPEFKIYGAQVIQNAKKLAATLMGEGIKLVGNGTENHLLLLDLIPLYGAGGGIFGQEILGRVKITVNKNTIAKDPSSPFYPSGVRLGTPALTSRGMKEAEMEKIGKIIGSALKMFEGEKLPEVKSERPAYVAQFVQKIRANNDLETLRGEVEKITAQFPLP